MAVRTDEHGSAIVDTISLTPNSFGIGNLRAADDVSLERQIELQ